MQLRQEKVDLEIELENEQEKIFNRLHKQLSTVTAEKEALEVRLSEGSTGLLDALAATLDRLKSDSTFQADQEQLQLLDRLTAEIDTLKLSHESTEKERSVQRAKSEIAITELKQLKRENASLRAKVEAEHRKLSQITSEKVRLQNMCSHLRMVDPP